MHMLPWKGARHMQFFAGWVEYHPVAAAAKCVNDDVALGRSGGGGGRACRCALGRRQVSLSSATSATRFARTGSVMKAGTSSPKPRTGGPRSSSRRR